MVYGGLTVALTALFVGVYFAVLAALSGQVVAVRYRWVAVVVATVAVLAAEPVRRRIQIRLERRFLGERGDPLGVLARLHAALSNGDEDENTVYATITRTVADGSPLALGSPRSASRTADRDRVGHRRGARCGVGIAAGVSGRADGRDARQHTHPR